MLEMEYTKIFILLGGKFGFWKGPIKKNQSKKRAISEPLKMGVHAHLMGVKHSSRTNGQRCDSKSMTYISIFLVNMKTFWKLNIKLWESGERYMQKVENWVAVL